MKELKTFVYQNNWLWSLFFSILLWLVIGTVGNGINLEILLSNMNSAAYLIIPAMGQMLVICSGRGAIDLSIPGVMTLSAFLTTGIADGKNANVFYAVAVVLLIGLLIGFVNSMLILQLRVPPIIATLGMGYIVSTFILLYNRSFSVFKIAPIFLNIARGSFLGVSTIVYIVIIFAICISVVLRRTKYGLSLVAVGQSIKAAKYASVKVNTVQIITYALSGMFAALAGMFLSARVGGAFLGMGDEYLLSTIGCVVIGGTPIFGGKASSIGTFFGSLFLILLWSLMQIAGFEIGLQYVVRGALILLVVIFASRLQINRE